MKWEPASFRLSPFASRSDRVKGLADADAVARDAMVCAELPAIVTIVMSSDQIRYGASGLRRIGDGRRTAVSIFDRFAIGSLTKSMTTTLAGILVQDNLIRWETKLYDVLPEAAAVGRTAHRHVTLRQLLTHGGGLCPSLTVRELAAMALLSGTVREQRVALLLKVVAVEPDAALRGEIEHADCGYLAAAAMLERATNTPFETLIQRSLFEPLKIEPRWACPSDEIPLPAVANPAGGIALRPYELAAYTRMHLQALRGRMGYPIRPGTAWTLHTELMSRRSIGQAQSVDGKCGPFLFPTPDRHRSSCAMLAIDPLRDRAAAVLTNSSDAGVRDTLAVVLTRLLG